MTAIRPHAIWGPGDTQLIGRIVERARAGRLFVVGGGTALIDTTYVDNAADALVAAVEHVTPESDLAGRAFVISNGEPLPVRVLLERICEAAGAPPPKRDVPLPLARGMAGVVERLWARARPDAEPPATRFLVDQLALAHSLAVTAIRPHAIWGPGDTQLIGRIVERARAGRLFVVGGGTALIDTTYVDNAADALAAAVEHVTAESDLAGRAFVISNGEPLPVRVLLERICEAAGAPPPNRDVPLPLARGTGGDRGARVGSRASRCRAARNALPCRSARPRALVRPAPVP